MTVSQSRFPLKINVGFLLNQPIGSSRDIHFDFPRLHLPPDLDLTTVVGLTRINRTPQGLLLQAGFSAFLEVECVRCLESFLQPIGAEFSELYAFKARDVTDSGLILPEDGNIDLAPLLREYLLLEIPISPLCKPDCKGLCIECGANLNHSLCEHQISVLCD